MNYVAERAVAVRVIVTAVLVLSILEPAVSAQSAAADTEAVAQMLSVYEWRNIGPVKGGRSIAVAGHPDRPYEYFFGATGGGLWRTRDGGTSWTPVTDGQIGSSSVGSIAVAPGDPDTVYLGTGERQLRSNVIQGDGVYRSADGGETWRHAGLRESHVVSRIRVHPSDPDIAYAAVLGDPYSESTQRGVFRTRDGGASWQRVLFQSPRSGAIDLAMDPDDPNVLYATIWQVYRKPWKLWSGGPESALFKSVDGGESWTDLSDRSGFPGGVLGKMAVSVSPVDSDRIWLNAEAERGGLYLSDDAGMTWRHVNGDRDLWQRSFYFMHVRAHPTEVDTVFVLNFALQKSRDAGRTFAPVPTRHVDIHDLWIDPQNPRRMIVADDGGGSVSVNGGQTWTDQDFPTAQIYRVATTADFPYHVCGTQQDAVSVCVPSRSESADETPGPGASSVDRYRDVYDGYFVGGGENGYVAPHPSEPALFFAGATNTLHRFDRRTGQTRDVHPFPYMVMGQAAKSMPERWNWVFPIVFSPLKPHALYAGSQHVWRSDDNGGHWKRISPDLTRADPATLGKTGGPIVLDQDGPEVHATIFTISPSHHDRNVVWTGSDDGLVSLTRDGGESWRNVSPKNLPPHSRVSFVEASPHRSGTAYAASHRYELGDRTPYLWKTHDFGRTWSQIGEGLPRDDFVHVIVEDPTVAGLLYLGTERRVYTSLDDGESWHRLGRNLPVTRVPAMTVRDDDLVIATHGRSFYLLESLAVVRELARDPELPALRLFSPDEAYRRLVPAKIRFRLAEAEDSVTVRIRDDEGNPVRTVVADATLPAGPHEFPWNLRHDGATVFDGMILEGPSPANGPWAVPGTYRVELVVGDRRRSADLTVRKDPRITDVSIDDLERQSALALEIRDATSRANEAVIDIRSLVDRIAGPAAGESSAGPRQLERYAERLRDIEQSLYQTKNRSPKDKIAFPIRLNNRLSGLLAAVNSGDGPPTAAQQEVFDLLERRLEELIEEYDGIRRRLVRTTGERRSR